MYLFVLLFVVTAVYAADKPSDESAQAESPAALIVEGVAGVLGNLAENLQDDGKITASEVTTGVLEGAVDPNSPERKLARGCFLLCCTKKKKH